MTPLTHAAVGLAIYQRVRSWRPGIAGWAIALSLAFASHFLLDTIPHLDAMGPLRELRRSMWLHLALGALGAGLAALLYRRSRDAGLIWLALSAWVGIAGFSGTLVRGLAGILLMALLAFVTRHVHVPVYLLGAMLAVSGDLVPGQMEALTKFHNAMHFSMGWGASLYVEFNSWPPPQGLTRLRSPYFLAGYGLELVIETAIFLLAMRSLSRLSLEREVETGTTLRAAEREEKAAIV